MGILEKENATPVVAEHGVSFEINAAKHSKYYSTDQAKKSVPISGNTTHQTFFWNRDSNSAELLSHWVSCRGHHFDYDVEAVK